MAKLERAQRRGHVLSYSEAEGLGTVLLEDGEHVVLHRDLLAKCGIRRLHPGCVVKVATAPGWPHAIATRVRLVRCRLPLALRRRLRAARRRARHLDETWQVTNWRMELPAEGLWLH